MSGSSPYLHDIRRLVVVFAHARAPEVHLPQLVVCFCVVAVQEGVIERIGLGMQLGDGFFKPASCLGVIAYRAFAVRILLIDAQAREDVARFRLRQEGL